jgi:hypothetical protein
MKKSEGADMGDFFDAFLTRTCRPEPILTGTRIRESPRISGQTETIRDDQNPYSQNPSPGTT